MKGELTKEGTIKILNDIKYQIQSSLDEVDVDKDCKEAEEDNKQIIVALDAAIEALEAEPCEDCVSRARVLSMAIFKQYNARQIGNIGNLTQNEIIKDWDDMIDFVETLPPVMPTPKTGHWIDIRNSNGTVIAVRCSNCEKSPKHAIKSDCCPNCGAKMKSSGGKE